jgi:hypothetical protein
MEVVLGAAKHFQKKCEAVFRPEMREKAISRKSVKRFFVRECHSIKIAPMMAAV